MSQTKHDRLMKGKKKTCLNFSPDEVKHLKAMYMKLTMGGNNKLNRQNFRDFLFIHFNMTEELILDRVFKTFDRDSDSQISLDEWIEGLSVFLKGSMEEQSKFCFFVYDLNDDGFITREEMFQFLRFCMTKQTNEEDQEENIKDLVDIAMKIMDTEHTGKVSESAFEKGVLENRLLMELLGTCLPARDYKQKFLDEISKQTSKF